MVLGVLMARPGAADTSTREAALGVIRALCTQRGAIHKPNVVRTSCFVNDIKWYRPSQGGAHRL